MATRRQLAFFGQSLLISLFLLVWPAIRGIEISLGGLWFALSVPLVAALFGRAAQSAVWGRAKPEPEEISETFPFAFVLGLPLLSLLLLVMAFLMPGPITAHYAVLCVVAVALWVFIVVKKRAGLASQGGTWGPKWLSPWDSPGLSLLFALLGTTIISYYSLRMVAVDHGEMRFTVWIDLFIHANQLSIFATNPEGFGFRNLAGAPLMFYHFASYLVPALYARLSNASALEAAAVMWQPLGFLSMALGAYVFARVQWGKAAGLLALWALVALPDGGVLPTSHSFLSFHHMARIVPASPYAVSIALLAFVMVREGLDKKAPRIAAFGVFFAMSGALFKAQLAAVFLPVLALYILVKLPGVSRRTKALILVGLGLGGVLAVAVLPLLFDVAPRILGRSGLPEYVAYLSGTIRPPNLFFGILSDMRPPVLRMVLAVPLLVAATFGALLLWYVALLVYIRRYDRFHLEDFLPLLFIVIYVLGIVVLPVSGVAAPFEMQHRPHALYYAFLAAYCGGRTMGLFAGFRWGATVRWATAAFLLASLLVPWSLTDFHVRNSVSYERCIDFTVPVPLWECALFIRNHSEPGAVFADSGLDPYGIVTGVSERFALRSFEGQMENVESFRERLPVNRELDLALRNARSASELYDLAREGGVRWYLVRPDGIGVEWPEPVLNAPAFKSDGYAVYDLYGFGGGGS